MRHTFFSEGGHSATLARLNAYWSFDFLVCSLTTIWPYESSLDVTIMDSGVSFAPSFVATYPMMPTHFMGTDPSTFYNGVQNYNTHYVPWVSSNFFVHMSSPVQSSP